jgi:hypothetical protein
MHLVYVDEVKHQGRTQRYHWLGALAFPDSAIQAIDGFLSRLASEFFGTALLDVSSEFHARDIFHGKGPYKGRPVRERVALYTSLLDVIASSGDVGRIAIRIEPEKMIASHYKAMAFMFLVEKVDAYMTQCRSIALLIADEDKELAGMNVSSLSTYRASGTHYAFGKQIRHIVDTVHHTRSHHSRLLQLADIYVYTLAMASDDREDYFRRKIVDHARSEARILFPTKYKYWPTGNSWRSPGT